MNNPKISILVPVYKVEKYLKRCVNSVLSQDFSDFELILVDDGSPDGCPKICDDYAGADKRVKVIHKENGGLVSARLAAFSVAEGDYLIFLDSDDYLYPNAVSTMYEKVKDGYDIVKGRNVGFTDAGIVRTEGSETLQDINAPIEYAKAIMTKEILPYLWGGIYKKELFTAQMFEGLLNFSIFEDELANLAIWKGVHRYCTIPNIVCAYYINEQSMMQQKVVSVDYRRRTRSKQLEFIEKEKELEYWADIEHIMGLIKTLFTPEIGWNVHIYNQVKSFVLQKDNLPVIKKYSDAKFLKCIRYKFLYRIYVEIYNFLFLHIKLKGHLRRLV